MTVILRILLCLLLMAGLAAEPAFAAKKKKAKAPPRPDDSMIVVFARTALTGCEPNCPEWIAAEGRITSATPQRFRKAFKQLKGKKLPILIQSGGGDVTAALKIGRMIREQGLDVFVAETSFVNCKPRDKTCRPEITKPEVYPAYAALIPAYCNSACSLVLASGVKRGVSKGSFVGLHQIQTTYWRDRQRIRETYKIVRGKKKVISRKVISSKRTTWTSTKINKGLRNQLSAYFRDMGASQEMFAYMEKAPPDKLYFANDNELSQLKLVNDSQPATTLVGSAACSSAIPAEHCVLREPKKPEAETAATN
jgi:hypothetical protein